MINHLKARVFNRKGANFSFAQAGEDLVLQRIFMGVRKGFYVDVGAYHPFKLSNTYLFYLNGWRGINIEPRPASKKLFDKIRPEDINLEIGIAQNPGFANYYLFEENTLNHFEFTDVSSRINSGKDVIKIEVEPLSNILQQYIGSHRAIDFISIDTEGAEYQVLASNNWIDFPIKVILIEDNRKNKRFCEVVDFLKNKGYKEVYRIPVNAEADSVFFMAK